MTLRDEGHRFVYTGKGQIYTWVHPAIMKDEYTDCTDMSDSEFEDFVLRETIRISQIIALLNEKKKHG